MLILSTRLMTVRQKLFSASYEVIAMTKDKKCNNGTYLYYYSLGFWMRKELSQKSLQMKLNVCCVFE